MQRSTAVTKNWKAGITTAVLSLSLLAAGAAGVSAQTTTMPNAQNSMYNQQHSNHNIAYVRRRLEEAIDHLQNDQHDYGGHRVQALQLLQQARQQLMQAQQWENLHPGQ